MKEQADEVYLSTRRQVERWPIELAEKLIANPLPWGPPAYAFGKYADDPALPDQHHDFSALVSCVDDAYDRHGHDISKAWEWANPICRDLETNGTFAQYTTQDLLDILFLNARYERFCDGHIRSVETLLRNIVRAVVQRVRSPHPPVFLVPKGRDSKHG